MLNHNKVNCFNKIILGLLLAASLAVMPATGQAAETQAGLNSEQDVDAQSNAADDASASDPVLDDGATAQIFEISQDLPEAITTPVKNSKNDISKKESQSPIVIEADQLYFNDETGDILAKGKVLITRDGQEITSEEINGNSKLSQVWAETPVSFKDFGARTNMVSDNIFYDYNLKTGHMGKTKGKTGNQYVAGDHIDLEPEKYIITNGTATRCPAKTPDYRISADKVEIWPEDKMILHNAKFWIKNKIIYTTSKYKTSLKKKDKETPFPRVGYRSSDGVYITQRLDRPVSENTSIFANIDYYSKHGFKPSYGLKHEQSGYTAQIVQGYYQDSDDHWIKKAPEFTLNFHRRKLGSTPLTYRTWLSYGRWDDGSKKSWHQSYNFYISHKPIKLNNTTRLYLGTGIEHIRESYDNSSQSVYKFNAILTKTINSRLNSWVSYHHRNYQRKTLFNYGTPDTNRELNYGFTYKIDRLNTIGITYSYDLGRSYYKDINYSWYRNLHSWQSTLTYKSKPGSWQWDISLARW